jgi:putative ABC transport system ATP-binding protein
MTMPQVLDTMRTMEVPATLERREEQRAMKQVVMLTAVSKVYEGDAAQSALDGITLGVGEGEFTAIMGPSGSGKSTLLNLIAGLDRPTSGAVLVADTELTRLSEAALARFRRVHIGFIFQFFHLLNNLSALDNVTMPAQLAGVKTREAQVRARALLERLGIAEKADQFPAKLSGGQRQRVAIARALINRPALLLADEPTGALDSQSGEDVMALLRELHHDGQTVILVTHDAKLATRHAERVLTLRDGRIDDDVRLAATNTRVSELVRVRAKESGR